MWSKLIQYELAYSYILSPSCLTPAALLPYNRSLSCIRLKCHLWNSHWNERLVHLLSDTGVILLNLKEMFGDIIPDSGFWSVLNLSPYLYEYGRTIKQTFYIHTLKWMEGNWLYFPRRTSINECKLFMEVQGMCGEQVRRFSVSAMIWTSFIYNMFRLQVC